MIELKKFSNGFEYIEVANSVVSAKIALQGAHIFSYKREAQEMLWLSEQSDFEEGKAIRGGVPICWPSFGMSNPDLPQHGFARTAIFNLKSANEPDENTTQLTFVLSDTEKSRGMWNYRFSLEFEVTIGEKLVMELKTTNLDTKSFELTQALHTYFPVSHIGDVRIKGLEGKPYFDTLTSEQKRNEREITFDAEYDAIFQEVDREIILQDVAKEFHIQNKGSSSVVVWNPWSEKCARMSGMSDEAYKEFVCIESANAREDKKILDPHALHSLQAIIS